MKKTLSILLSVFLIAACLLPAFASGENLTGGA